MSNSKAVPKGGLNVSAHDDDLGDLLALATTLDGEGVFSGFKVTAVKGLTHLGAVDVGQDELALQPPADGGQAIEVGGGEQVFSAASGTTRTTAPEAG